MQQLLLTALLLLLSGSAFAQTQVDFYTNAGNFRVELREDLMPITAGNFLSLVDREYYDGVIFHRVVAGFVVQGGDPTGTGSGGPGYTIQDEYHPTMNHDSTGVIAMAKTSQPNSAGSQFYFSLDALPNLDQRYSVFGSCIQGLDVIELIGLVAVDDNDRPTTQIQMDSVRRVLPLTGLEAPAPLIQLEISANPFQDQFQAQYQTRQLDDIRVSVWDMQGKEIAVLSHGPHMPGVHAIEWDARSFPAGIYTLRIRGKQGSVMQKLVKR